MRADLPTRTPPGQEKKPSDDGAARRLDGELVRLAHREARCRLVLGRLAHRFLRIRGHHEFGFARVGDWTRERLGLSAREVQSLARVAERLRALPLLRAAFEQGALSWTKIRLLVERATRDDEEAFVALARGRPAHVVAALVGKAPPAYEDEDLIDDEPPAFVRIPCPRRVKGRWREVVELASRVAGAPLAAWQAADCVAAEGFSARGIEAEDPLGDVPVEHRVPLLRRRPERLEEGPIDVPLPDDVAELGRGLAGLDAVALEARLRTALGVLQRIDAETGRLLLTFFGRNCHRQLGFSSVAHYARDRLDISGRKARALVALERASGPAPDVAAAYRTGQISWLRALTVLPVAGPETGKAWVMRAREVTLKRLIDEVEWARGARDGEKGEVPPPPADASLERQIGARSDGDVLDAEVRFFAPESVAILLRDAIAAFGVPSEPPWRGLERLLEHARDTWLAQPRHPDPVFARDGWRCAVPACSARRGLHDHHIVFRSRGGTNDRANRITVCVWHHLRGIHGGRIRAQGEAPDRIIWELGIRGGRSLLRLQGERYLA